MQTGISVIETNRIRVNGRIVFEQAPNLDFTAFAKAAFKNLELTYPKFYKMDKLCKLGFLAVEYLLAGNPGIHPDESTAIVLCNSSGSLDSDLAHLQNAEQPSPAVFVYTLPNIVIGEIAIRHGIKGETAFFICEHDDDPLAQQYATNLLTNGMASSCITGWVDYTDERYLAKVCYFN
jgi:hypothetical protein